MANIANSVVNFWTWIQKPCVFKQSVKRKVAKKGAGHFRLKRTSNICNWQVRHMTSTQKISPLFFSLYLFYFILKQPSETVCVSHIICLTHRRLVAHSGLAGLKTDCVSEPPKNPSHVVCVCVCVCCSPAGITIVNLTSWHLDSVRRFCSFSSF